MATGSVNDITAPDRSANTLSVDPSDGVRRVFSAPAADWKRALLFMLSMSLFGMSFYPAALFILICLVYNWRHDRMHFMMQTVIVCGAYSMYKMHSFHFFDLLMLASVVLVVILRKDRLLWRLLLATFAYMVCLLWLMTFSAESMMIQIRWFRMYMVIITFIVPLGIFADREFDIRRFFTVATVYAGIMCIFYVIDGFIIQGFVLVPVGYMGVESSVFWDPIMKPFSLWFPRKYPQGIYLLVLCVYPLIYVYKLSWKQVIIVVLTFMASRTMTVIAGFLMGLILFQRNVRRTVLLCGAGLVGIGLLFIVDKALGSPLRIASTVEQFTSLDNAKDVEDLAEFGSNRMAQVIPKMEILYDRHKEWVGFGFIHPDLSKSNTFQLTNDLYTDIEQADESIAAVEVTQVHTILMVGYIGLIVQTAYYIWIYFILRGARCRYSLYYLSVVVIVSIFGIGGFGGLTQYQTLILVGLVLGVTVLQHRRETTGDSVRVATVPDPIYE